MLSLLRKFRRNKDGVAAVEFALILPALAAMTLGVTEVSSALECRQRVTAVAAQGADLAAQYISINTSQMNDVLSAMKEILYPFPSTAATSKIVITSVMSDGNGNGKVAWSKGSTGATTRAVNSAVTLPSGLMAKYKCVGAVCTGCAANACSVIYTEVTYNYANYSDTVKFVASSLTLTDTFYARPRRSVSVTWSTS